MAAQVTGGRENVCDLTMKVCDFQFWKADYVHGHMAELKVPLTGAQQLGGEID